MQPPVLNVFVDRGEPVRPGIDLCRHRPRSLSALARLFTAQRAALFDRHAASNRRILAARKYRDDPLMRALSVSWAEQGAIGYQAQQRLLLGLFLSGARQAGIGHICVTRPHYRDPVVLPEPDRRLDGETEQGFAVLLAVSFAEPIRADWLNSRHIGCYDLSDPLLFRWRGCG